MRPVDLARAIIQPWVSGIKQQTCAIVVSAVGYVRVCQRLRPCVCELRVNRLYPRPVEGLKRMVVRIATPKSVGNETPIPGSERPDTVGVLDCIIQTLRCRYRVGVTVLQQMNPAVTHVG